MQYMKKICSNYDNPPNALTLEAALYVAIDYLKELLDIVITRIKASNLDYKIRKNGIIKTIHDDRVFYPGKLQEINPINQNVRPFWSYKPTSTN